MGRQERVKVLRTISGGRVFHRINDSPNEKTVLRHPIVHYANQTFKSTRPQHPGGGVLSTMDPTGMCRQHALQNQPLGV